MTDWRSTKDSKTNKTKRFPVKKRLHIPRAKTVYHAKLDERQLLLKFKNTKDREDKKRIKMSLVSASNLAKKEGRDRVAEIYESAYNKMILPPKNFEEVKIKQLTEREKESFFKKPIEKRKGITYEEANAIVQKIAEQTGTKMEIISGLKRKGYSENDVDILVHTDRIPDEAVDVEEIGHLLLLMKNLRMRVDLFIPNTKKQKVPKYEQTSMYSPMEDFVGFHTPDFVLASNTPETYYRLKNGGVAYLPTWGYLSKRNMEEVGKLKLQLENLRNKRYELKAKQHSEYNQGKIEEAKKTLLLVRENSNKQDKVRKELRGYGVRFE